MEKQESNQICNNDNKAGASTSEFVLQWGKRIRCVRFKEPSISSTSSFRRKITSRIVSNTSSTDRPLSPHRVSDVSRHGKSPSLEKERHYTTRGSATGEDRENGNKSNGDGSHHGVGVEERGNLVWPKLYISLSSKEKEEDFLAMKGCKLPQRPKKRAKFIQRTLLLVSPGAWLTDMCQERYEVREKKTPKKRPRGLKAMGAVIDTDSE